MTDLATIARKAALHFEAKKDGLSQRQDGSLVLRLKLHPSDMPDGVIRAAMGQRYIVALVAIGDNEEPLTGKDGEAHGPATSPVDKTPASVADIPVRARKPVAADKRLAQQAGILCSDPVFQTFLYEHDSATEKSEEAAATAVRVICSVKSRADIIPGTYAAEQFDKLVSKFTAWRLAA